MIDYIWNELCGLCADDPNAIRNALDKMYEYLDNTDWGEED